MSAEEEVPLVLEPKPNQTSEAIIATGVVFLVLSSAAVVGRLLIRRSHIKAGGIAFDDILQPISLIIFGALCITAFIGVGLKVLGVDDATANEAGNGTGATIHTKIYLAAGCLFVLGTGLTKLAAIWLYRRTFCVQTKSKYLVVIWTLLVIVGLWTLTFFVFQLAQCGTRLDALWAGSYDLSVEFCGPSINMDKALVISDFILDTLILMVPMPKIFGLNISLGRKFGIATVFAFAFWSYAVVIFQLVTQIQLYAAIDNNDLFDATYENTGLIWARMLEVGTAVIAVNLPPLYRIVKPIRSAVGISSIRSLFKSTNASRAQVDREGVSSSKGSSYAASTEKASASHTQSTV